MPCLAGALDAHCGDSLPARSHRRRSRHVRFRTPVRTADIHVLSVMAIGCPGRAGVGAASARYSVCGPLSCVTAAEPR